MKIKLDENLPVQVAVPLREFGHDVDTVFDEALAGSTDKRIWQAAQASSRFLITQDLDFSDIRKYRPGTHAGILLLRLNNPSRRGLITKIEGVFRSEDVNYWNVAL